MYNLAVIEVQPRALVTEEDLNYVMSLMSYVLRIKATQQGCSQGRPFRVTRPLEKNI